MEHLLTSTDKFNDMWRIYKKSDDNIAVRQQFCKYLFNETDMEILSGVKSIEPILM